MVKKFWLALTLAYFASLNQFYEIFLSTNRFSMRWSWVYHVQILVALLILGAAYFLSFVVFQRLFAKSHRLTKAFDCVVMIFAWYILSRCAVSMFVIEPKLADYAQIFHPVWIKCLLYIATPLLLAVFYHARFRKFLTGLCLVLSPVLILITVTPLTYKGWERHEMSDISDAVLKPPQDAKEMTAESNLYFFLFDEWSMDRILEGERLASRFSELSKLAAGADLYIDAYSPGNDTITAIPRTLLQLDPDFITRPGGQIMRDIYQRIPLHGSGSIFALAPDGTYCVAVGLLHDYEALLGDTVHRAYRLDDPSQSLRRGIIGLLRPQLAVLRFLGLRYEPEEFMVLNWGARVDNMKQLTLQLIREMESPVWAYLHFALPHQPFMWGREGQLVEQRWPVSVATEEGYLSNMDYIDTIMGEFIGAMKEAGTYDSATIIVASDHGLRGEEGDEFDESDPLVSHTMRRHVPLIVKRPRQVQGRVIKESMEIAELFSSGAYLDE